MFYLYIIKFLYIFMFNLYIKEEYINVLSIYNGAICSYFISVKLFVIFI